MGKKLTGTVLKSTVLLVDDDANERFLLGRQLRKRGFIVDTVDSADACLARLIDEPAAIVVTDIEMPGMSGIELCRVLRGRYPSVKAIVVSGQTMPSVIAAALKLGACAFFSKPVNEDALETAILAAADVAQPQ